MSHEVFKIQRRLEPAEFQACQTLNQAAPVQNTWYDIVPTTLNCRVYVVGVNIEDTDETLQVQAIIDGVTLEGWSVACTHSTVYFAWRYPYAIDRKCMLHLSNSTSQVAFGPSYLLEGRSVQVQVRKTSANGAGNLTASAMIGVLSETDV